MPGAHLGGKPGSLRENAVFGGDDMDETDSELSGDVEMIVEMMDALIEDFSVPRNIRSAVAEGRERMLGDEDLSVRVTAAIYKLDDISNDINMPPHTRTEIWSLISQLEAVREKCK